MLLSTRARVMKIFYKKKALIVNMYRSRFPKGEEFQYDELNEYDTAHVESDDCSARYPGCEDLHESISM